MKKRLIQEMPFWIVILLPIVFLINTWELIPSEIPLHYNFYGEADKWGSKDNLWWLLTLIPLSTYLILLIAKRIDPKNKLGQMGGKYYFFRFGFTLLLSVIFMAMLYSLNNDANTFPSVIFIIVAFMFIFLGNYFRNIKHNYFLGYRTPWALENEQVWRNTHKHSSSIWVGSGILMLALNLLQPLSHIGIVNGIIIIALILDPIVYSYIIHNQLLKSGY